MTILGLIIKSSINLKEIIQQSFRQNLLWTSKSAHLVVCSINDTEIKLPWPTQDHINKKYGYECLKSESRFERPIIASPEPNEHFQLIVQ